MIIASPQKPAKFEQAMNSLSWVAMAQPVEERRVNLFCSSGEVFLDGNPVAQDDLRAVEDGGFMRQIVASLEGEDGTHVKGIFHGGSYYCYDLLSFRNNYLIYEPYAVRLQLLDVFLCGREHLMGRLPTAYSVADKMQMMSDQIGRRPPTCIMLFNTEKTFSPRERHERRFNSMMVTPRDMGALYQMMGGAQPETRFQNVGNLSVPS